MSTDLKEQAARELEVALEVIDATGWRKISTGDVTIKAVDEDGEHCAIGAVAAADTILEFGSLDFEGLSAPEEAAYVPKLGTVYYKALEAICDNISVEDRAVLGRSVDVGLVRRRPASMVYMWNDKVLPTEDEEVAVEKIKETFNLAIEELRS